MLEMLLAPTRIRLFSAHGVDALDGRPQPVGAALTLVDAGMRQDLNADLRDSIRAFVTPHEVK